MLDQGYERPNSRRRNRSSDDEGDDRPPGRRNPPPPANDDDEQEVNEGLFARPRKAKGAKSYQLSTKEVPSAGVELKV